MIRRVFLFHAILLTLLSLSFFIHRMFFFEAVLLRVYFLNAVAAVFVYWLALVFRSKHQEYTGFYFLSGTVLKFFIFFAFALPEFKQDNVVSKAEFFSFFIPYLISLIVETVSLIFLLSNTPNNFLEK